MEYILLSELSLHQQNYKIKIRNCHMWESTDSFLKGDIFSMDCLLVDEKVDAIILHTCILLCALFYRNILLLIDIVTVLNRDIRCKRQYGNKIPRNLNVGL